MIVVTTPTGNIGGKLVPDLLDAGEAVRVVVRDPAKLDAAFRDRVDVVEGSHGDAATMDRALYGADALFWCVPPTPAGTMEETYRGFTRPAADAIRRRGTGHVVAVTALGRGTEWEDGAGLVTASLRMVDLLAETGAAVRGLAMPSFMENTLRDLDSIRQGRTYGTVDPGHRSPYTATRDMATAAARLLVDRSWSGREDVPVLGPDDLSPDDIAAIVSKVAGREVTYVRMPFDALHEQLLARGIPADFARGYVEMMRAKNEGMDDVVGRTPDNTGATSFRAWAEEVLGPALGR